MNGIVSSTLVFCTLTIALSEARADRTMAADPSTSNAARAWQASYRAEAAGNYDTAYEALDQLPVAQRQSYMAHYRRGWLQYCLGHHAESVASYYSAIGVEPETVEARVAQLLPLKALGKWHELIEAAQAVLKRDSQNYIALQHLAYAHYKNQHYAEAEQTYRRVVRLYPSDLEMRAGLGWAVLRLGRQPEAAALFRAVLELSPKHASASSGLQAATTRSVSAY